MKTNYNDRKTVKGTVWWKSKTLWFNIITVGLAILQLVPGIYPVPPEVLTFVLGVGNILLRLVTVGPIKGTSGENVQA